MPVPYIDVSHLASASSFYSAILQPLNLSYVDLDDAADRDPPNSVTYGFKGRPVLQIRQNPTPLGPLRLSSVVLTAPSRSAVVGFHAWGLRANPPLLLADGDDGGTWLGIDGGVSRAVVHDLDGNRMEAAYPYPDAVQYTGSAVRETQSTREEAGRILDWNYDVASSHPRMTITSSHRHHPASTSTMTRRPEQPPAYPLRRSLTHDSSSSRVYQGSSSAILAPQPPAPLAPLAHSSTARDRPNTEAEPAASASPRQSTLTSGLSTTTVVGALLGVAAGAAMTYGLVSRERDRKPRQEFDANPGLPRRATFPDKVDWERRGRYEDRKPAYNGYSSRKSVVDDYPPRKAVDDYPAREAVEYRPNRRVVYGDVVDDYAEAWPPPRYLTQYGHQSELSNTTKHPPRTRATDDSYDTRSRRSSRYNDSRPPSSRSRSEAPPERGYVLAAGDERSLAPSRQSAVPRSSHSQAQPRSHRPVYDADRESYVSARTHHSSSTTRPPRSRVLVDPDPELEQGQEVIMRSRAGSRVTTTKFSVSGGQPLPRRLSGRAPSHVSARDVPLPMSGVGSSHADWDDDLESLAPSDSISCVGSKTSRRSRRHH